MSVDPNTLVQFSGKNVNITLTGDYADLSGEGRVEAAGPFGVAFKPKGKGSVIVEPGDIEAIETAAVIKKITRKSLLPATLENVRQHLVDRHGYAVADIEKYSPEQALEWHNGLEHKPLGHDHEKKAEEAQPAAA